MFVGALGRGHGGRGLRTDLELNSRLAGLGIDWGRLLPPRAVRDTIAAATKNVKVSIPTPAGPIEVPVSQLPALARSAQLKVATQAAPDTALERATAFVQESIPGGWVTVGIGALVAGALVYLATRKRGR